MQAPAHDVSAESLMRVAAERAGSDDWGDRSFAAPLALLVDSAYEHAALNTLGQRVLRSVVLRHLRNRLLVRAYVTANPGAGTGSGPQRPIIVTGLPRSGTTVLHELLALGTGARVLRLWEALTPVPPATDGERQTRIDNAAAWLDAFYASVPDFRRIHAISGPEGPEECDALLQNSFASQHFDDMFDAPDYSAWLATADLSLVYREYAQQLRLLSAEDPAGSWFVLKSPLHVGHLAALASVLPDAVFVICHRLPVETVSSYASLIATLRRAYSDTVSLQRVGEQALERCRVALSRALAVCDSGVLGTVIDVCHHDIVADPLSAALEVRAAAGRPVQPDEEARMREWVARNPRDRHGAHDHRLPDFGLDERRVRSAFAFSGDRFG